MENKPRVGLVFLAAEWFWRQNIQAGTGKYKNVSRIVDEDSRRICEKLSRYFEVHATTIIHTVENAKEQMRRLESADLDMLIVCSILWSEDHPLIQVLDQATNIPLVVWCYVPDERLPERIAIEELFRRSGPVGTLQHSAVLKRLWQNFGFVVGSLDNTSAMEQLRDYADSARVAKTLRKATIGLLPYRCELMTGTFVDEFRLATEVGPKIRCISIGEYAAYIDHVTIAETDNFIQRLRGMYPVCDVDQASLSRTAGASLGLAKMIVEMNLDALAINDLADELHRVIKVRPFLGVPEFFEKGFVVGMEGDLATTTGMLIMRKLTAAPVMYTEIFTYDESRDALLMGHAGMHDVRLAGSPVRITPDFEYCETGEFSGAWLEFKARSGPVTLASFFSDTDGFKIVTATGTALADGPVLEGFAHVLVRPDVPLPRFFEQIVRTGLTQHWVVTYGDVQSRLQKLAALRRWKYQAVE
jgi:L-arabinose isomerase